MTGFLALLVLPFVWAVVNWSSLATDFLWSSRNVNDVNVGMARWVDDNLPACATIGVVDGAGAVRFFGNRYVVELTGSNTHTAIGPPARMFPIAEEHDVDYLVGFRNVYFDSWPQGQEVFALETDAGSVLGARELVVYGARWDLALTLADKSVPYTVDLSGFRLLDSLDVGDQVSEEAHIYSFTEAGPTVERTFNIAQVEG